MKRIKAAHRALAIQFFKFGIVGFIGFLVDSGVLLFCVNVFGIGPYVGRVISFLIAATTTWICNRTFTFRGIGSGPAHAQLLKFLVVSAGGFIFNYGTYAILVSHVQIFHDHLTLGVAAGSIAGMFFNFFVSRKLVFR